MIEKATTTWAKHGLYLLVCFSYHENPKGFQGHFFFYFDYYGLFSFLFHYE